MTTVQTIRNAVTSAVQGGRDGIHAANQVVGAARAIDSFMGAQPVRGGRVGAAIEGYHGGQRADALRQQFARTNPRDAPGPRTAAFYQYRHRAPGRVNFSGTQTQHEMLNRLRRQQEQIRAARTGVRVGRFRDQSAPTAEDFVSSEDLIRRFASTPELAERANEMQEQTEFRRTNPRPNRRPSNVRLSETEFYEERRNKPRRPPARTAMPPGAARGEMPTPGGPPRSLAPR